MRWIYLLGAVAVLVLVLLAVRSIRLGEYQTDDYRFQHGLHVGMTKDQVMEVWRESGEVGGPTEFELPKNTLGFMLGDRAIICHAEGSQVNVHFDNRMRVQSWQAQRWKRACL